MLNKILSLATPVAPLLLADESQPGLPKTASAEELDKLGSSALERIRRGSRTKDGHPLISEYSVPPSPRDRASPVCPTSRAYHRSGSLNLDTDLAHLAKALNTKDIVFTHDELLTIRANTDILDFPKPGVIYRRGREAVSCYVVIDGYADVYVDSLRVATRQPGDLIGTSIFKRKSRTSTVIATTPLKAGRINFDTIHCCNPSLFEKLQTSISKTHRLRKAQKARVLLRNPYAGNVIAFIAHDGMKDQVVDLVRPHLDTLSHFTILATRGTANLLREIFPDDPRLFIIDLSHGPHGGDFELFLVQNALRLVVFLTDTLNDLPHVRIIQRTQELLTSNNITVANNLVTAELLMQTIAREVYVDMRPPGIEMLPIHLLRNQKPRASATDASIPLPTSELAPPPPPPSLSPRATREDTTLMRTIPLKPPISSFDDLIAPVIPKGPYVMLVANNNTSARSLLLKFLRNNLVAFKAFCFAHSLTIGTTSELFPYLRPLINDPSDTVSFSMYAFSATVLGGIEEIAAMQAREKVHCTIFAQEPGSRVTPEAEHLSFSTLQDITLANEGTISIHTHSMPMVDSGIASLAPDFLLTRETMSLDFFHRTRPKELHILLPETIPSRLESVSARLAHFATLASNPDFLSGPDGPNILQQLLNLDRLTVSAEAV
jgi:methylglyoxal synthase